VPDIGLPFGEWLPDLGENENPGLVEAKNVIARPGGYEALRAPATAASGPFGSNPTIRGAYSSKNGDLYVLTNNTIYHPTGNVSVSASTRPWVGTSFGRGVYFLRRSATNSFYYQTFGGFNDPVGFVHSRGTFTEYTAQLIDGVAIARWGNFLVAGGAHFGAISGAYGFRWSAFNNPISWAPSQTTLAGAADVGNENYGPLTGLHGGRYNLLFQEKAVSRVSFVGPPTYWNQTVISETEGAINHRCIVQVDDFVYFISRNGVCVTNGAGVENLSRGKVSEWLMARLLTYNGDNGAIMSAEVYETLHGVHDAANKQVRWLYFSDSVGYELIYSYETNRFTRSDNSVAFAFVVPKVGSYEDNRLQVIRPATDLTFAAVLSTGTTRAAEMTTGYRSITPGKRVAVNAVEPVYDGAGAKVAINTKATLAGAAAAGTPVAVNSLGIANVRADGRAAAVSVTFDAGATWGEFKGAIVTADDSGAR
jgi:hypothetical protein